VKYQELESSSIEFKLKLPQNDQIIKTVVGFCNQYGGKIIIGVDNDGTIVGLSDDEIQNVMEYAEKSIFESTAPPIIPLIYSQVIGGKTVLIIEVFPGMNKPYYVKSETLDKGTYVRLGRSTLRATADMIEELKWQSRGLSYDTLAVYHAKLRDLDELAIERFLKQRKGKKKLPENFQEALLAYHLISIEHAHVYPSVAGILLFGTDPDRFFSEAMIICTRFSGVSGREALATRDCEGKLTTQFNEAFDFIVSQLNRSFTIKGRLREEQLEVPEEAVREALLNAIVHRNYHIKAPIKIAIFDNRIEIFSPGNFPGPLNSYNLKMGFTFVRNTAIAKVFREMGLVEKLGSGLLTIFKSYEKRGLKEPQIVELENSVKCILPRPGPVHAALEPERDEMERILSLFEVATELKISDMVRNSRIPRATVGRKLAKLLQLGIVKKIGKGKSTRYLLISREKMDS
jgi:ATP-dependent DNA helicase RecG